MEQLAYIGNGNKNFVFRNPISGVPYNHPRPEVSEVKMNEEDFMDIFNFLKKNQH